MAADRAAPTSGGARISHLDGLRGVAITVVLLYHAYARWPELYPYHDRFAANPLVNTVIAGVNLFFIISGFVILMTLHKSRGFGDFMQRRWLRLFPAMLVCALLIVGTAGWLPERPQGPVGLLDIVPGITLIGDGYGTQWLWHGLGAITGHVFRPVDGAFWSLYVEVKFYVLFGLLYFAAGEWVAIATILILFVIARLTNASGASAGHGLLSTIGLDRVAMFLNARSYGYFAAGALFYLYDSQRRPALFGAALMVGLLASLAFAETRLANLALTILFTLGLVVPAVRAALSSRLLVFLGFVSYPLYLIHQNMMVALIVKLGHATAAIPAVLLPAAPIAAVITLAWIVARYLEPGMRGLIRGRA